MRKASEDKRSVCIVCEKRMRDFGQKATDAPGTVARGTLTTCGSCRGKQTGGRGAVRAPEPDLDEPCVLVRSDIRPSTFQVLSRHARRLGITEGQLLSQLADRAVGSTA